MGFRVQNSETTGKDSGFKRRALWLRQLRLWVEVASVEPEVPFSYCATPCPVLTYAIFPIVLRVCYAIPGTDIGSFFSAATRLLCGIQY
eukprot:590118-Rhodomonas_salina.3